MDIIRQRLIGKPHSAIIDELLHTDESTANIIIQMFDKIIAEYINENLSKVVETAIGRAKVRVIEFIIDYCCYSQLNRRTHIDEFASYIISNRKISIVHVRKFFSNVTISRSSCYINAIHICDSTNKNRIRVAVDAIAAQTGMLREEVLYKMNNSKGVIDCYGDVVIEYISTIKEEHLNDYIRMVINTIVDDPSSLKSRHYTILNTIAKYYPNIAYGALNLIGKYAYINIKKHFRSFRHIIVFCNAEIVNNHPPARIFNYIHYKLLMCNGIKIDVLMKPLLTIYSLDIDMFRMISYDLSLHGYSLFDHFQEAFNYCTSFTLGMTEIALDAVEYDSCAVKFLQSDMCVKVISNSPAPYRSTVVKIITHKNFIAHT